MDELDFSALVQNAPDDNGEWDPGFEGNRRVVVFQLGPMQRVFPRPTKFRKRFYHRVYDIPIEDWNVAWDFYLLSGFCVMRSSLSVRYQASLKYVQENADRLPEINGQIKSNYEILLKDTIEKELILAEDMDLMSTGFEEIEERIENIINETLIEQGIQCRARCQLEPSFKALDEDSEFTSSGHFQHDQAVLQYLQRNNDLRNQRKHELFRQEREALRSKIEHEEKLLEHSDQEIALEKVKESKAAESVKVEIEAEQRRQIERQKSHERLLAEKLEHESRMQALERDAELQVKKKRFDATEDIENFERREIELLLLKKQQVLIKKEIEKISSAAGKVFRKVRSKPTANQD